MVVVAVHARLESAELAVLWLMREYRFDLSILQQALLDSVIRLWDPFGSYLVLPIYAPEDGLKVNFAKVNYNFIAEFVGLD